MYNFKKIILFSLVLLINNTHSMELSNTESNKSIIGSILGAAIFVGGAYICYDSDMRAVLLYKCGLELFLYEALFDACEKGDLNRVKYLSGYVDDINKVVRAQTAPIKISTLLGVACEKDRLDIVQYLVEEKNANVNREGLNPVVDIEDVPLIRACSKKIRQYLFEKGAAVCIYHRIARDRAFFDFNLFEKPAEVAQETIKRGYSSYRSFQRGLTPLMRISDIVAAQCFIDAGADVNAQDSVGFTPLFWAYKNGNYNVAKLLISHGAHLMIEEGEKRKWLQQMAMIIALHHANIDFFNYFLKEEKIDINMQLERSERTVLHQIVTDNFFNWAQQRRPDSFTWSDENERQRQASNLNKKDLVVFLLCQGADPKIKDKGGRQPFEYARDKEIKDILKKEESTRKLIIENKCNNENPVNFLRNRELTGGHGHKLLGYK